MVDLFITLLSMGLDGYKSILDERVRLVTLFRENLERVASVFGEKVLHCPRNTISFGITLDNLVKFDDDVNTAVSAMNLNDDEAKKQQSELNSQITKFGSMLFTRCISGTRIVPRCSTKTISGHTFDGFGSSNDKYPSAYMTAACAVGMCEEEMKEFFVRLEKAWLDYRSKLKKESKKKTDQ
jgi:O-phospho-L-seryl-tRNASec:L-selenocysteinyl-tRNA synthase